MKKLLFILSVTFACGLNLYAQKANLKWGPLVEPKNPARFRDFFYSKGDLSFAIFFDRKTPVICKYNASMKETASKEIKAGQKDSYFNDILYNGDEIVLFSTLYDKKDDKYSLYALNISKDLKAEGKPKLLLAAKAEKKRESGNFSVIISKDTSKVLVFYNAPYKKDENEKYAITVYDNKLTELYKSVITLPYSDKRFSIKQAIVSNSGDVYVLGKLYDTERTKETKKGDDGREAAYKFVIIKYGKGEADDYVQGKADGKQYKVDLKGLFIQDVEFKVTDKNDLILSGFYSKKNTGALQGVFYARLNGESGEMEKSGTKDFDNKTLGPIQERWGKFMISKDKGGDIGLSQRFYIKDIYARADGSAVILAEYYYLQVVTTTSSNGATSTRYIHHYGDKLVINVTPEAQIDWIADVPVHYASGTPILGSCGTIINENGVHMLYHDHPKNANLKAGKKPKLANSKKMIGVLNSVNNSGKISTKVMFEWKKLKLWPMLSNSDQVSNNEMLFLAGKFNLMGENKKYQVGRVTVD